MATTYYTMTSYMQKEAKSQKELSLGGLSGGLLSGLIMIIALTFVSAGPQLGAFAPLKSIAATLLGPSALEGGISVIMLGALIHFTCSGILGILFAYFTSGVKTTGSLLAAGLAFGILVWAAMSYFVLPLINPTMLYQMAAISGNWFVVHLFYGGALFLTPYFESRVQDYNASSH